MPSLPEAPRIGWIGTGVMGASMCRRLLDAGLETTVFSRTRAKAEPLIEKGATWVESPRAVAARSDVVFTMVGFPADVREVVLGEDGVLAGLEAGGVLVEMTTSEPSLAIEIAETARERDADALDAPVSGGDVGARDGKLSIMIGGDAATVGAVRPLLARLGSHITHAGEAGSGQHTKMVNQTLVAANMVGVCEALLYAHRAGLDLERVLEAVSSGAAGSFLLSNLGPRIVEGDFAPGFYIDHFIKDMGIALTEARRMKLAMPGLALVEQLYVAARAQGHGKRGTQALALALAELSDVGWPR